MVTPIDSFSLTRQSPAGTDDPYQPPHAAVLREGRAAGFTIEGAKIEAQFALDADSYLLLVSDDCPYEETLRAYLLNANLKVIDQATLGYAYTAGVLRDIQIVADDALTFAFTGNSRFRLKVHPKPRHLWNASGGAGEVFRFLSRRRLEITRETLDGRQEVR